MANSKAVYLNLQANINQDTATKLIAGIEAELKQGMTELHLLISSPGCFIDPGMAMYNFLRGIPVSVTTYNYGSVDSVATVVYCAGKRRLATPYCAADRAGAAGAGRPPGAVSAGLWPAAGPMGWAHAGGAPNPNPKINYTTRAWATRS